MSFEEIDFLGTLPFSSLPLGNIRRIDFWLIAFSVYIDFWLIDFKYIDNRYTWLFTGEEFKQVKNQILTELNKKITPHHKDLDVNILSYFMIQVITIYPHPAPGCYWSPPTCNFKNEILKIFPSIYTEVLGYTLLNSDFSSLYSFSTLIIYLDKRILPREQVWLLRSVFRFQVCTYIVKLDTFYSAF